jgi:hypothetical protein
MLVRIAVAYWYSGIPVSQNKMDWCFNTRLRPLKLARNLPGVSGGRVKRKENVA